MTTCKVAYYDISLLYFCESKVKCVMRLWPRFQPGPDFPREAELGVNVLYYFFICSFVCFS